MECRNGEMCVYGKDLHPNHPCKNGCVNNVNNIEVIDEEIVSLQVQKEITKT